MEDRSNPAPDGIVLLSSAATVLFIAWIAWLLIVFLAGRVGIDLPVPF